MSIDSIVTETREWRRLRIDSAWAAVVAIFAVLAVLAPQQAGTWAVFTAKAVWGVLPFFVLSVGPAAYAQAAGAENLNVKAFGGGVTSIPAALAVWAIARRQVFQAYLAFATVGGLLSGLVFQAVAG